MLFAEGTGSFGQNADASAAMAATFLTAGGFHQLGKTLKAELPPVDWSYPFESTEYQSLKSQIYDNIGI